MALRERLIGNNNGSPGPVSDGTGQHSFQEMKARLHRTLINRMDLTKLQTLTPEQVHAEVSRLAESVLAQEAMPLSVSERERLVNDVQHELFGLGPLEPLLADSTISDILVNKHDTIYIERRGKIEPTNVRFKDDEHLMRVIERIVSSVGRRIDESSPMVDARLQDGSRVNAIIPPLSIDGPVLSIRRFGSEPLRMVSGFVSLLQSRYADRLDDDAGEFMRYIVDGVERMQALIRDLLSYSRVGRAELEHEPVAMGPLVQRVLEGMQTSINETDATIEVGDLPTVRGDASQLVQLVQNLVVNALKFTGGEPPVVRITAARDGDEWAFAVADEGIGIDPEFDERIFQVFQRLHAPNEYPGTGVGLAICRAIAERHGGRIWVESTPGEGSVFRFTLPA